MRSTESTDSPSALTIGLDMRRSFSWVKSCCSSFKVGTWHSHISARPGMGWDTATDLNPAERISSSTLARYPSMYGSPLFIVGDGVYSRAISQMTRVPPGLSSRFASAKMLLRPA